ncbi:MAG: hypothetical protein LBU48_05620 [Coriobacteriales bacterium]|jgi:hypothetical protein|nr:hypothetical protein [Coriobacteriales bacterium]
MINTADITPDYDFYADIYHGKVSESDFDAALCDAVAEVEFRLWPNADLSEHIQACKMAVCAIVEIVANPDKRIISYSAGKTSETFNQKAFSLTSEAQVLRYLGNRHILKRGQWL